MTANHIVRHHAPAGVLEAPGYSNVVVADLPLLREARQREIPDDHRPASTAVQVGALFEPGYLLEVEALAVIAADR